MKELMVEELYDINGGKLQSVSDYLLLGAGVSFCFCIPIIGIPAVIAFAIFG